MKKLIIFTLLAVLCISVISTAENKNSQVYFTFDSPKLIELSSSNADKIADDLLLEDKDGKNYNAVVNLINNKKIVISPIEKIEKDLKIKDLSDYKVSNYSGNVYIQNKKNLKNITDTIQNSYEPIPYDYVTMKDGATAQAESSNVNASSSPRKSDDYSKTNIQVKGVDEADIVKTDGKNIYYVKNNELVIVDANTKNLSVKSVISVSDNSIGFKKSTDYYDGKIFKNVYIDNNKLSLIYVGGKYDKDTYNSYTLIDTYNVSNPSKPKLISSSSVKGNLIESRKKGNVIYLTTSDYFNIISKESPYIPYISDIYRPMPNYEYDSSGIDLTKILYMPFNPSIGISNVTAVDIDKSEKTNQISYMGNAENIYVSFDNIYMISNIFSYNFKEREYENKTNIKKFSINNLDFNYVGEAEFNGNIVNQFSLTEDKGNLFVAYTKNQHDDFNSDNNIISYDKNMKKISELSGLAKGERIYSVRFMKDKAYMVTFKQVDPLFVIDIKEPKTMKVLGYLKIPGYSNHLHPYKENYLIGFGKNTKNAGNAVLNDGFKMSLFDISNFSNPKEVDVVNIGERGSYSEIEYDHKALMFDERRNVFSIPVYVTKIEKKISPNSEYDNIIPSFAGAYVYNISEKGFDIKGRITHYTQEEQNNSMKYGYKYDKQIKRSLQIGDNLYTLSDYGIKVNNINTLKEIAELTF